MKPSLAGGLFLLNILAILPAPGSAEEREEARTWRQILEADWQKEAELRGRLGAALTPAEDAVGGCDGVKNGLWAFHTGLDENPWWQVDLGQVHALDRVLVFNRCDGAAERAVHLRLRLSDDGQTWQEAYRHDGTPFFGFTDNHPLTIPLRGARARFVRVQLPGPQFLHLDEVEVYGLDEPAKNLALGQPAEQSSISQWSTRKIRRRPDEEPDYPLAESIERGRRLAADLREQGVAVERLVRELDAAAAALHAWPQNPPPGRRRELYHQVRETLRALAFTNPLLDFDRLLFVKRRPGSFSHMSDQYYGWWSRPGGGLFILEGFKSDTPRALCLTADLPPGSFLDPDLSYDGRKVLFAYCKYYPDLAAHPDKVNKEKLPEDAFYHLYEMNLDGSGLRRLTYGRYDDFSGRYLPNGEIVFLSTRRGQAIQCGLESGEATRKATLPDSYVRCGGDHWRPVAVYTLHVMDSEGGHIRQISPFENFEWTPNLANDGSILYARWDYVDRNNMPYMSLWATHPDGTQVRIIYGNFTPNPHCIFQARPIPNSHRLIFTASGHHAITGGSLVLLDPLQGVDGEAALTRLTPEVCFPETEGWPPAFFADPYPLSEKYYLTGWSTEPLPPGASFNAGNGMGLYLFDVFGNLTLLYRDPEISSGFPLPLRPRPRPPQLPTAVDWKGPQEGRFLLQNVYQSLEEIPRGTVKKLRIVGVPAKTQPEMNTPAIGLTQDDPGKYVLGTVPVEADGSAYFRVPAGTAVFFQALNEEGLAVQTMRTLTYVQPGQTLSCVGCHEPRDLAPPNQRPTAASREPSKIHLGPEGSWPLRFDRLVQPVLDQHCVPCHRPGGQEPAVAKIDLTPAKAYEGLVTWGHPSLQEHVRQCYQEGRSRVGHGAAQQSPLRALLRQGHYEVKLSPEDWERLITWMDTYGQRLGAFSEDQEQRLLALRASARDLFAP